MVSCNGISGSAFLNAAYLDGLKADAENFTSKAFPALMTKSISCCF